MDDFTEAQFDALAVLQQKIDVGYIRQVTGNDYIAALDSGDAIASIGWSGDVLALGRKFGFSIPESGGMIWADNMLIPSVATHKADAERLMNYYYDPLVAARLAAWVQYVCPVQGAQEAMQTSIQTSSMTRGSSRPRNFWSRHRSSCASAQNSESSTPTGS